MPTDSASDVTRKSSVFNTCVEVVNAETDTLLFHNGGTEGRQAVDPAAGDLFNICHAAAEANCKKIHHKAGVNAGAEDGNAVFLCKLVHFGGKLGFLCHGEAHFFRSGNNIYVLLNNKLNFVECLAGKGIGCNNADIAVAVVDNFFNFGVNKNIIAGTAVDFEQFIDAPADACGMDIAYTDDVNTFFS